jgi:hypothetical protein
VVASSIPPHLEVLGSAGPGRRLHRPGDGDQLLGALGLVLTDPRAERAGAVALRDQVLRAYCWDDVTERTETVYRDILQRRAASASGVAPRASA